jgi:peptidoglycan hydrolase-like amidase
MAIGRKLGISTSYHSHTDGQTERFNHTWEEDIRCYVHPLHDDWDQHLTDVEFAINSTVSTSTTMPPFKATLGFEDTSPTTATFGDNESSCTLPEQAKIMVEIQEIAHNCVKAAHVHKQEYANRYLLKLATRLSSRRQFYESCNNHVLN